MRKNSVSGGGWQQLKRKPHPRAPKPIIDTGIQFHFPNPHEFERRFSVVQLLAPGARVAYKGARVAEEGLGVVAKNEG
jgi:hypothetical protein